MGGGGGFYLWTSAREDGTRGGDPCGDPYGDPGTGTGATLNDLHFWLCPPRKPFSCEGMIPRSTRFLERIMHAPAVYELARECALNRHPSHPFSTSIFSQRGGSE